MASSHWRRSEPELLRSSAPSTENGAGDAFDRVGSVPAPHLVWVSSRCTRLARVSIADLLHLGSVGLVGAATAGLFFGSGFLLLGRPSEQIHAESAILDGSAVNDPHRSGTSGNTENNARVSKGAPPLSSTASEATIIATMQDTAPGEPTRSSISPSVLPLRGQGESDHPRKLSRPHRSRSDTMPVEARVRVPHGRSAGQDREHDPDGAADIANQQENNQLRAAGLP
jgi:hypothetical protein